jgi:hypothetical protein
LFKNLLIAVLALLLAACGGLKARHATAPNATAPAANSAVPLGANAQRIDETRSELRVLVYRAGPLARFGHNHVMVNRALRGAVNIPAEAGAGAGVFSLEVPVAAFVVDDAQARAEEGPDFAALVPDDAKSGTLRNMLGKSVLNAAEYPVITVTSVSVSGPSGTTGVRGMLATVAISVAGHQSTLDVPFSLDSDANGITASGSLELRQSALGLTPYSLMMGALQVQDAMTLKFKIVVVP